jgi:hypothetical protein
VAGRSFQRKIKPRDSAAGSSEQALPWIIHPLLNPLNVQIPEIAETALGPQIFFYGNHTTILANSVGPSTLDFIDIDS